MPQRSREVPQRSREEPQRSREEPQRSREAASRSITAMVTLYVALVAATIGGLTALIERGAHQHAQPAIAGGYDLRQPNPCFGAPVAIPAGAALPRTAPAQPPARARRPPQARL